MSNGTSRRDFLRGAAYTGIGIWIVDSARPASAQAPSERVNFGCIGVGGKGDSDTADANRLGNVVAICDVDDRTLEAAAQRYPKAMKYNDYRKMLEEMGKSIDAVTVSTPDHHHAIASSLALN